MADQKIKIKVPKLKIKAPSKLLWKLRFQNICADCGRHIPEWEIFCKPCKRKRRII